MAMRTLYPGHRLLHQDAGGQEQDGATLKMILIGFQRIHPEEVEAAEVVGEFI